jgi:hypothetical protein
MLETSDVLVLARLQFASTISELCVPHLLPRPSSPSRGRPKYSPLACT